jgi:hypothetical protein
MVRGHGPSTPVQRREIPYWQERGWTRNNNIYTGNYQSPYAAFSGYIVQQPGGHIDFFFYAPSREIQQSGHWACFQHQGSDWYLVHMARQPRDVSSGIITIERLITEAFEP